jgi:hypothetical protein
MVHFPVEPIFHMIVAIGEYRLFVQYCATLLGAIAPPHIYYALPCVIVVTTV